MEREDPQKIPEEFVVEDLLRIKGENESYIQELKHEVADLKKQLSSAKKGKLSDKSKKHIAGLEKRNKKLKDENQELTHDNRKKLDQVKNYIQRLELKIQDDLKNMTREERLSLLDDYCPCCGADEKEYGKCYCCPQYDE